MRLIIQPYAADDRHVLDGQRPKQLLHFILLARALGIDRVRAFEDVHFELAVLRQLVDVGLLVGHNGLAVPDLAVLFGDVAHQAVPGG